MSKEELQGMADKMGIQLNNLCYLKQDTEVRKSKSNKPAGLRARGADSLLQCFELHLHVARGV